MDSDKIGLVSAVLLIIGNVIGAGTFTTTGIMLGRIGDPGTVMLLWVFAGLVMLLGAACYGALARQMPESGGEYLFLSRIFHPVLGCLAGWISLLVGFSAPIAVCAYAAGEYARHWGVVDYTPRIIGSCLIVLVTLLHSLGTRHGLRIQNLMISVKLLLIVAFIALTVGEVSTSCLSRPMIADVHPDNLAIGFIWAFFAYSGWNSVIYIADEMENSDKNLMWATMIGSLLIMLIYLLLNFTILGQQQIHNIEGRVDYMLLVAEQSASDWAVVVAAVVVNLALLSSLSALIMLGPRVYAKMASDGFMPRFLASQGGRYHKAIVFQGMVALLILWLGTYEDMLTSIGYMLGICCVLTVAGLVKLKLNDRGIAIPFWPFGPVIFILCVTCCVIYHIYHHPLYSIAGVLLAAPGLLFWFFGRTVLKV